MRISRTALVLALSVAIATLPFRPDSPPVPPLALTGAYEGPLLKLRGSGKLPDGAVLTVRLSRLQEQVRLGRLEPLWQDAGGGPVVVTSGAFSTEERVLRPGLYRAVVEGGGTRSLPIELYAWDDAFLPRVLKERKAIETLILHAEWIYGWMEAATESEPQWKRVAIEILANAVHLQDRAAWLAGPRALFPAAEHELALALRLMTSVAPHFFWSAAGFEGAFDAVSDAWVKGPDGRAFGFAGMAAHLSSVRDILQREALLWTVKEGRRISRDDPGLAAARSRHAEIRASLEDMERRLDRIEEHARGKARRETVVSLPPTPPRFVAAAARLRRIREARKILEQADQRWEQIEDRQSPALYRKLQSEYRDVLDDLQAWVRVGNRARAESE